MIPAARWLRTAGFALLCASSVAAAPAALADRQPSEHAQELLVFAAASLTDVLQQIGDRYGRETGQPVKFSFASSATLARQIESGARADVFVSADVEWMDYLQTRRLIDPATRVDVASNRLALVAPSGNPVRLAIAPGFALASALGTGRLATGDPDFVPVGRYAKAALTSLGVWDDVSDRLVRTENVRAALVFVARGEVPLGVVYETDALAERRVRVVDVFPASSHPPITYPAVATKGARAGAGGFLAYLRSAAAREAFRRWGFGPPSDAAE